MALALNSGQHAFHVIQAADQAWPKGEAGRAELGSRGLGLIELSQPSPKRSVDHNLERLAAFLDDEGQLRGDVLVESHRGAHTLML